MENPGGDRSEVKNAMNDFPHRIRMTNDIINDIWQGLKARKSTDAGKIKVAECNASGSVESDMIRSWILVRDEEFRQLNNEVQSLRNDVAGITEAARKGCCKTQLLGVIDELVELRRDVIQMNKLLNMMLESRGFGTSTPNSFSPMIGSPSGVPHHVNHPMVDISPNRMSGKTRESKYANKRKSVGRSPVSVGSPVINKLVFDSAEYNKMRNGEGYNSSVNAPKYRVAEFILESRLAENDIMLVKYLLDGSLDPTEIVFEGDYNEVRRHEIRSLRPEIWLDGEIISTMCEMLGKESRINGFGVSVSSYITPRYAEYVLSGIKDWTSFIYAHRIKEFYMSNLLTSSKAFFPILDESSSHWFLMIVDLPRKNAEIWDSLPDNTRNDSRVKMGSLVLKSLDTIFGSEIRTDNSKEFPYFSAFSVHRRLDAPTQPNYFDCGMYVIAFMKNCMATLSHDFQQIYFQMGAFIIRTNILQHQPMEA